MPKKIGRPFFKRAAATFLDQESGHCFLHGSRRQARGNIDLMNPVAAHIKAADIGSVIFDCPLQLNVTDGAVRIRQFQPDRGIIDRLIGAVADPDYLETVIGLCLFLGTIPLIAALAGGPLNAFSVAGATLIFTQWNIVNHTWVNLPWFMST